MSATLTMGHDFPKGTAVRAAVDVKLLLQTLKTNQTDVGSWVHVIGYVTSVEQNPAGPTKGGGPASTIGVQALLVWTAEDLDIPAYERALTTNIG